MKKPSETRYITQEAIFYIIIAFLAAQVIMAYVIFAFFLPPEYQTFILAFFLIFFIGLYVLNILELKQNFHFALCDLWILLLILLGIISTVFAEDKAMALLGTNGRHEGLVTLFSYYMLFLCGTLISDGKKKLHLLYVFMGIGCVISIGGILSAYGAFHFLYLIDSPVAVIPFENQNFFGSFAVLFSAVCIGVVIYGITKRIRSIGLLLSVCGIASLFCCDSSSPIIGLIMIFILLVIVEYWIFYKRRNTNLLLQHFRSIGLCFLVVLLVMFIVNTTRNHSVLHEFQHGMHSISQGIHSDQAFSSRMAIWKMGLTYLPEYWLTGAGIDNFSILAERSGLFHGIVIDKLHNEYLQILLTEGVFALMVYLLHLLTIFVIGLSKWSTYKKGNDWICIPLTLAFFGYIAQAFFNISVINVAPFFWLLCGLLYQRKAPKLI